MYRNGKVINNIYIQKECGIKDTLDVVWKNDVHLKYVFVNTNEVAYDGN